MIGICSIILIIVSATFGIMLNKFVFNSRNSELYEDIIDSVLNSDTKTRKAVEKQCNEYLEHRVINGKATNDNYLKQAQLILDKIKYLNMIKSIEPCDNVKIADNEPKTGLKSTMEESAEGKNKKKENKK